MIRRTNEAIDHALSILALGLDDKHRLSYNFFSSTTLGSSEEVDRDVQLIQVAQSSLNDRIPTIISQRHTYHNTITSRIHTIPLEIFTRILLESIEEVGWSLKHLHTLACVSKYWTLVVLSTPRPWTIVKYNTGRSSDLLNSWELALRKNSAYILPHPSVRVAQAPSMYRS
ncbi:hypothetical protein FRB94_005767 [Tulasnella sp. JGI-2019a]|nr:hypothetical protein FRB94_005767 [Tulasnella sp. JGI-2019a]